MVMSLSFSIQTSKVETIHSATSIQGTRQSNVAKMCLPCFPWRWTRYEDPLDALDSMPEQSVWVHDGRSWTLQRVVGLILSFSFFPICPVIPFQVNAW